VSTPNLDQYIDVATSQEGEGLSSFLTWLVGHDDLALCLWDEDSERYSPVPEYKMEEIMATYFDIDLKAVYAEREQVYQDMKRA
jgi:hypothetical protein